MKFLCAAAALLLAVMVPASAMQDFGGPAGELAQMFRQTNGTNLTRKSIQAWLQRKPEAPHGVSEIGIERTQCFGQCPAYTLVVRSNDTFRYTGRLAVERKGEFTGKIERGYFYLLARFIKESGFMEMEDEYETPATDSPTTYTTVVLDGKRKLIRNYAQSGPGKLWAVEELIDGLLAHAKWDQPVPVAPAKP